MAGGRSPFAEGADHPGIVVDCRSRIPKEVYDAFSRITIVKPG